MFWQCLWGVVRSKCRSIMASLNVLFQADLQHNNNRIRQSLINLSAFPCTPPHHCIHPNSLPQLSANHPTSPSCSSSLLSPLLSHPHSSMSPLPSHTSATEQRSFTPVLCNIPKNRFSPTCFPGLINCCPSLLFLIRGIFLTPLGKGYARASQ